MFDLNAPAARLLPDEPAVVDLLSFDAIAQTITDALLDQELDSVALGLSGNWGSGKTAVLDLVESEVRRRAAEHRLIVVVRTAPGRHDPTVGSKETLIGEVLTAVQDELARVEHPSEKAKNLVKALAARADWAKALKIAATTAVTLQLPNSPVILE